MKEIAIIIPAYKAERTLPRTLGSIITQKVVDKIKVYIVGDYNLSEDELEYIKTELKTKRKEQRKMNTGSEVKRAIDYRQEFLKAKGTMFMQQTNQDYGYVVYNERVVGESKEAAFRYIDFIDEMENLYDINAKEVTQFMINYFFVNS